LISLGWVFIDDLRSDIRSGFAELKHTVAADEEGLSRRKLQLEKLAVSVNLMSSPKLTSSHKPGIAIDYDATSLFTVDIVAPSSVNVLVIRVERTGIGRILGRFKS
jgi:hypothetical protein